ncbi:hypothetical protein [Actimicrobium sp. CCI2.3]|uniref:hypothetical protein n=1 Tax=Actimicrobium sp. CCI2.3 TaxID=3048616 RepID=UPI002AB4647E|nr:hypothetical protein [Actimicrobium sp. CCI2.3]MDY7575790.1 hypothetical protein [Actimicrobium sp. CCI2.3]MEB0023943.1 hypothetical protein [Actimicrobium sp. CCI2.3]
MADHTEAGRHACKLFGRTVAGVVPAASDPAQAPPANTIGKSLTLSLSTLRS